MFLESNWIPQLEILELKTEKTVILKIFTIYLPGPKILTIYLLVEHVHLLDLLGHKTIYLQGHNILTIQLVLTQIPTEKDQVLAQVSFSSCQGNLIKTFQIEGMIALITKMTLIFSSDLLNGHK